MQVPEYKSAAKNKLIEMLVSLKDVDEGKYEFYIKGTKEDAERFIHRMRVELSRFRGTVRKNKKVIVPFKILIDTIEQKSENRTRVVLTKSTTARRPMEDISEIFNLVDGIGSQTNG